MDKGDYMSKTIKWIQISDLHFGNESEYCKKSREALKKYIIANKKEIDYIFITGDIIYAQQAIDENKKEKAYKEASEYIKAIYREIWGNDTAEKELYKHIFIVPGNHDLIRDKAHKNNIKGMIEDYEKEGNEHIDASYLKIVNNALRKYYEFYGTLTNDDLLDLAKNKFHYVVKTEELNILHINTCIASCSDNESGKLLVGYDLISKALERIDEQKPTIAIAHHNFGELSRTESEKLEILLKKYDVVLYLCGHAHMRESEMIIKYNQIKRLHSFTCGTLMASGKKYIDTVIFYGEIDLKLRKGKINSLRWDLANEWHDDMDFGLVQGMKESYRTFSSDSIDMVSYADLPTKGYGNSRATGIYSQIVSHQSTERTRAFLDLNDSAKDSLSIYGVGISSVTKNTELLNRILKDGGVVKLCMVDPNIFKEGQCLKVCNLDDTNFCVYSQHIDQYIRSEYYEDIIKSYHRIIDYKKKAEKNGWNLQVRFLKSFIPLSINIINENKEKAALIIEYNMPFTNKRLLIKTSNNENNTDYFQDLCNVFSVIWEKAVEIKDDDN